MGSPDLQPEESTSYQLGYQAELTDTVGVSVNGFYNDVKDLIQIDMKNPVMDGGVAVYSSVSYTHLTLPTTPYV